MRTTFAAKTLVLLAVAAIIGIVTCCDLEAKETKRCVVGGDFKAPPYQFIDANGNPNGFNVEVTRAVADIMGIKVEFRLKPWNETRKELQDGVVDVVQGMSYSDERLAEFDFSAPLAMVNHAVFSRRDAPPLNGLENLTGEVVVHRGGVIHDYLLQHGFKGRLLLAESAVDALKMVDAGNATYAVVSIVPGMYIVREYGLKHVVLAASNVATYRYCYAVRKGNVELLSRFNEGLAILVKTGQHKQIQDKWLGAVDLTVRKRNTPLMIVAAFSVAVLLAAAIVAWNYALRRKVASRTAELHHEIEVRKGAEAELRRNQEELIKADRMAAIDTLVSGVAHEINNPTGLILINLPILKEVYTDVLELLEERYIRQGDFLLGGIAFSRMRYEIPRMLDEMQNGAKRIKYIVEDLRDFARRDDVKSLGVVDMNLVAQSSVRLVDSFIKKSTTHFAAHYSETLPRVYGSALRLEQVVVNLLLNACQALQDGRSTEGESAEPINSAVVLQKCSRGIELETFFDSASDAVVLRIKDEGIGIESEHLAHLTDPFFTTKRNMGGTGLGLFISSGIAKEHGGTLSFESVSGKGTTVTLKIPSYAGDNP